MRTAEWVDCKLGDVLTLQRGFDLPKKNRREGNIPIVSSSGISGYHDTAKVNGPGVVTGRYGTLGEVFYLKENFWPLNTTLYVGDFKLAFFLPRSVRSPLAGSENVLTLYKSRLRRLS